MSVSRIPVYNRFNPNGMLLWFSEMARRNLLFHPEESARDIFRTEDGTPLFTDLESKAADKVLAEMFAEHGDKVIAACYPVFMRKAGIPRALDA